MKKLDTAAKEITRQASQSALTRSPPKSLPSTALKPGPEKITQIALFIRQCFDIQNTYGKTPEQLKTLQKAMIEDLGGYPLSEIEYAFRQWRRISEIIPTPAAIIEIVEAELRAKRAARYTPPEGRTNFPTEEGKAEVKGLVAECRKNLTLPAEEEN